MSRRTPLLVAGLGLVIAIGGLLAWRAMGPKESSPPGAQVAPPTTGQQQSPVAPAGPGVAACPGGGDASIAVAGPATARCTALPVLQPINAFHPLDPDPGMPTYSHPEPAQRDRYQLDLQIDPASGQVTGRLKLQLLNRSKEGLDKLYFHLFPNAPYFTKNWEGPVLRPGSLTVASLQVDGKETPVTGGSEEIMAISLPQPLLPGARVEISLAYTLVVPSIENDRLGADGQTLFLGNAYPILAMHDQAGWHLDRYVAIGDPFYSEVADYQVTVQVPAGYDAAATGRRTQVDGGFTFTAERVRDFGLAVSKGWSRHERTVDGVTLHYLHDQTLAGDRTPEQLLDQIERAVRFFNQQFGPYPYADLTVVDKVGMEYPQFVMGGPEIHTVLHEVAHQWWYGVVGNDELRQIWDEGLTEYSALLYEATVGVQTPASRFTLTDQANWPMDDSLYRYAAAQDRGQVGYGQAIYRRGWRLWEALRQQMGDERFFPMIQSFYQRHQFGTATWADWRQAVSEAGGPKAVTLFDQWVYGTAVPPGAPSKVAPVKR